MNVQFGFVNEKELSVPATRKRGATNIDTPSEGSDTGANDWVLVNRNDLPVLENLQGLVRHGR